MFVSFYVILEINPKARPFNVIIKNVMTAVYIDVIESHWSVDYRYQQGLLAPQQHTTKTNPTTF